MFLINKKILETINEYGEVSSSNNLKIVRLENLTLQLEEKYNINTFITINLFRNFDEFKILWDFFLEINKMLFYSNQVVFYKKESKEVIATVTKDDFLLPHNLSDLHAIDCYDFSFNWLESHGNYYHIDDLNVKEILLNIDDLTFKEISLTLDIKPSTFRTKLKRDSFNYKEWLKLKNIIMYKKNIFTILNDIKERKENNE